MKIFVTHSSSLDFKNELYAPLKNSELNNDFEFIFPHDNGKLVNTKELLRNCNLVIAEVSHPSTGSGIEQGWADAFGVPILYLYKEGSKISGSLREVSSNFISYQNSDDMILKINDFLKKFQ